MLEAQHVIQKSLIQQTSLVLGRWEKETAKGEGGNVLYQLLTIIIAKPVKGKGTTQESHLSSKVGTGTSFQSIVVLE